MGLWRLGYEHQYICVQENARSRHQYPESVPGRILSAWRQGLLEVVLSRHILDEVVRVLSRLRRMADVVDPVVERDEGLRDEADQPVLRTLRAAKADYLITGDTDLLALAERYPIVTPAAFWGRHGS